MIIKGMLIYAVELARFFISLATVYMIPHYRDGMKSGMFSKHWNKSL
jgi:hypothetical protein